MTLHITSGGAKPRRVVLSCDVAGCPVQVEPPPAERWRSDSDARTYARSHAVGWTHDPTRSTDYCPDHTEFSTPPAAGVAPPRPTAGIRDSAGNPLNRDDYAAELRKRLAEADSTASGSRTLTPGQAAVVARLLDELAGVYQGEGLGTLAAELSEQLGKPA